VSWDAQSFAVLDIETAPSDASIVLAGRGSGDRSMLHEMTAASVLRFRRNGACGFDDFRMLSVGGSGEDEADMLRALRIGLDDAHGAGATLVTWNGIAHDLPTLRTRAARHWLFGAFALPRWDAAPDHLDLMRDGPWAGGRWSSLVDTCAALGVPALLEEQSGPRCTLSTPVRKCQLDVAVTALLLMYGVSEREADARPLMAGWVGLAGALSRHRRGATHLRGVVRHPFVRAARAVIDASGGGRAAR